MANTLSDYIDELDKASRGLEVKNSLIDLLIFFNDQGIPNALTLEGHSSGYFTKYSDWNDLNDICLWIKGELNKLNGRYLGTKPDGTTVEVPVDWPYHYDPEDNT